MVIPPVKNTSGTYGLPVISILSDAPPIIKCDRSALSDVITENSLHIVYA